jgi:excisionase family DNA binding protein
MLKAQKNLTPAQREDIAKATEQPLVDMPVVCADIGVGERTVSRWVKEKKIPVIRLGHRTLRFRLDDVRRAVARFVTKEIK